MMFVKKEEEKIPFQTTSVMKRKPFFFFDFFFCFV